MSDPRLRALLWSICLILSGILILLFNFGVLDAYTPFVQYVLAGICALAAFVFFASFARSRAEWWRLIPAWTLAALAGMILVSVLPGFDQRIVAALLFGGLALAFGHIYMLDRSERWWAIIPGGFMLVLGIVIGLSSRVEQIEWLALVLFVGMGAVFFLLYLLDSHRRQWWALIPGSVLVIFGVLVLTAGQEGSNGVLRWWPMALVVIGVLVGLGARRKPAPQKLAVNTAPKMQNKSAPAAPVTGGSPTRGTLGEYTAPAPGATVDILPDDE